MHIVPSTFYYVWLLGVKSLQSLCLNKAANLSSQEIVNAPPVFRTKIQDYTTAIQQNIPVAKILQLN